MPYEVTATSYTRHYQLVRFSSASVVQLGDLEDHWVYLQIADILLVLVPDCCEQFEIVWYRNLYSIRFASILH